MSVLLSNDYALNHNNNLLLHIFTVAIRHNIDNRDCPGVLFLRFMQNVTTNKLIMKLQTDYLEHPHFNKQFYHSFFYFFLFNLRHIFTKNNNHIYK